MTTDVLIIGAGAIGASIAYHLAKKGHKNILVIDKGNEPGTGSTGKATGGFRAQFGSEINIKLSLLSRDKFLSFKDEIGIDPEFIRNGYLFIARTENEMKNLQNALNLQHNSGLAEVEEVTAEDIDKLNPHINMSEILGGTFCKTDGFISPMQILKGYTEASERLGVKFEYDTRVVNFRTKQNGKITITDTVTSGGDVSAGAVINASGAWAGHISKLAGYKIPVTPLKRQVAVIKEQNILPDAIPMTIFVSDSFHFRMRNGRLILLLPVEPESIDIFDTNVEENWLQKIFSIAQERIPCLKNCSIDKQNSWAGLYEMSPDEHILLGKAPSFENFFLANGSSGHGVMHSPAIGHLLAEIITYGKTKSLDISSLSPSRFIEGKPVASIKIF